IVDGALVEPGRIYLADSGNLLGLDGGRFRVSPAAPDGAGERGVVDSFLVSLAQDRGADAVAVILDGTGSDGTLGVTAVKERGGLTLAQARPDGTVAGAAAAIV
ncbi:chemotaxis protein CheB, partial [Methylobacterium brachiatum]